MADETRKAAGEGGGEKRGPGRPTLCTPECTAEVCKWLASGCYVETATALAGISVGTYYDWKKRGEAGEAPFSEFLDSIQRAENQAEARAVALIQKQGEEDPKALQWWLSHRHADRWADRSKVDHGGQADNPVQVEHTHAVDDATLAAIALRGRARNGDANGDAATDPAAEE